MKQIDARLLAKRKAKEARLQIVAECYSKGLSYSAIRIEVMSRLQLETYSKATVMHDVETLLAQWRAERLPDTEAGVDLFLERNRQHYKEVREEWEKSREDRSKTETKRKGVPVGFNAGAHDDGDSDKDPGRKMKTILKEEKNTTILGEGDPRYMELMIKLEDQRAKVLGIYAPVKQILTGADGEPLIPSGSGSLDINKLTSEERAELLKLARKIE